MQEISLKVGDTFTHCVHQDTVVKVLAFSSDDDGEVFVVYEILTGARKGIIKHRPLGAFLGYKVHPEWSKLKGEPPQKRYVKKASP